jgi:hypothetical protein
MVLLIVNEYLWLFSPSSTTISTDLMTFEVSENMPELSGDTMTAGATNIEK